jgi:hypothetical protein
MLLDGRQDFFKGHCGAGREGFERSLEHRKQKDIAKVQLERLSEPFLQPARSSTPLSEDAASGSLSQE